MIIWRNVLFVIAAIVVSVVLTGFGPAVITGIFGDSWVVTIATVVLAVAVVGYLAARQWKIDRRRRAEELARSD